MRQKRRLVRLDERKEPTCRRADCDRSDNPTHWVDVEPAPELLTLLSVARQTAKDWKGLPGGGINTAQLARSLDALCKQVDLVDTASQD
ncbi:MAG: hypothetical protein AB1411_15950 [Nitrospirota bacterium]